MVSLFFVKLFYKKKMLLPKDNKMESLENNMESVSVDSPIDNIENENE